MTVNVGSAVTLPATLALTPGLGVRPRERLLLAKNDFRELYPQWIDVTASMRSWRTVRGREDETQDFDAGTATIVLGNADRAFDPAFDPTVRPRNRVLLVEEYNGTTRAIFAGLVERWLIEYPSPNLSDSTATMICVDETKVLNGLNLPTTSPPRDSYPEFIASANPDGYYDFLQAGSKKIAAGNPGPDLKPFGSASADSDSLVVGDADDHVGALLVASTGGYQSDALSAGDPFDAGGLSEFTVEVLARVAATSALRNIVHGPAQSSSVITPANQYGLLFNHTGLGFVAGTLGGYFVTNQAGGTSYTLSSANQIAPDTTYHLVLTLQGGFARIYKDGVQVAVSSAVSGTIAALATNGNLVIGDTTAGPSEVVDELVFYRRGMGAAEVLEHFKAARQRGFLEDQTTTAGKNRVAAILDAAGSRTPRVLDSSTGAFLLAPRFMRGQSPLEEIRATMRAVGAEAATFIGADGSIRYDLARSASSLATFGDDQAAIAAGTELPYLDFARDDSDSFIVNDVSVTRTGPLAVTQSASDAASIAANDRVTLNLDDVPIYSDPWALNLAQAIVAKRAALKTRVTSFEPKMEDRNVADLIGRIELLDTLTFKMSPPGAGGRFSQDLAVQRIERACSTPGGAVPQTCTLSVSPL